MVFIVLPEVNKLRLRLRQNRSKLRLRLRPSGSGAQHYLLLYHTCLKLEHNHRRNRELNCVGDRLSSGYSPDPRVTRVLLSLQCVFARHVVKEIPTSVGIKNTYTVSYSWKTVGFKSIALFNFRLQAIVRLQTKDCSIVIAILVFTSYSNTIQKRYVTKSKLIRWI